MPQRLLLCGEVAWASLGFVYSTWGGGFSAPPPPRAVPGSWAHSYHSVFSEGGGCFSSFLAPSASLTHGRCLTDTD